MTYTIEPSSDGTYILLKVEGEINRHNAMSQNIEAHAHGRKSGINRYLVAVTEARNAGLKVKIFTDADLVRQYLTEE